MAVDRVTVQRGAAIDASTPARDEQAEVLESLVAHPGWRILAQEARAEWDTRERNGRRAALNDTDDKRSLDKLRQITAAQEAVEWVLGWPLETIARRKRQETTGVKAGSVQERTFGPNLAEMMNRRGGL